MNALDKNIEINKKLIAVLDELLGVGDWQASLFLRTAGKQIQTLREQAQKLLAEVTGSIAMAQGAHVSSVAKAGHIKVYISLYQAESNDLQKWFRTLKSLMEYSLSRPVYLEESQVRAMIRSKENAQREAYAIVFIQEKDIIHLPGGRMATDKLGHELLTLKAGAIKPENIIEFIHGTKHYVLGEKGLVSI